MPDRPGIPEEKDRFMLLDDQRFDLRFDFFLCPTHGLIVPSRFNSEWTTDEGCPVPNYVEESCDEPLQAVFLDSMLGALRKQGAEEERARLFGSVRTALRDLRRGHTATVEDGLALIVGDETRELGLRADADTARAKGAEEERERLRGLVEVARDHFKGYYDSLGNRGIPNHRKEVAGSAVRKFEDLLAALDIPTPS